MQRPNDFMTSCSIRSRGGRAGWTSPQDNFSSDGITQKFHRK